MSQDEEIKRKENREDAIRAHEAWAPLAIAHFNVVLAYGSGAIKLVTAVNGGALVALLGFTAGIAGKDKPALSSTDVIAAPMMCFAIGLIVAVAAAGALYFTQNFYAAGHFKQDHFWVKPYVRDSAKTKFWDRAGHISNGLTIFLAFSAYVAFLIGIWRCFDLINAVKLG